MQVAKHLSHTYGNRASEVAKLASFTGKRWPLVGKKLSDQFPYIEAEVKYSIREYASTVVDVLARRTRLAFLNVHVANEVVPRITEIMAKELGWDKARKKVGVAGLVDSINIEEHLPLMYFPEGQCFGPKVNIWTQPFCPLKRGCLLLKDI